MSSTLEDLREEREEIAWEPLKAGRFRVGMESSLIVAGRYGYIEDRLPH